MAVLAVAGIPLAPAPAGPLVARVADRRINTY
jgi:hypothetical protein